MDVIEKVVKTAAVVAVLDENDKQLEDEKKDLDEENKTDEIEVNEIVKVAVVGDVIETTVVEQQQVSDVNESDEDLDTVLKVAAVGAVGAVGAVIASDKITENVSDDSIDDETKDTNKLEQMDVLENIVKVAAIESVVGEVNRLENEQLEDEDKKEESMDESQIKQIAAPVVVASKIVENVIGESNEIEEVETNDVEDNDQVKQKFVRSAGVISELSDDDDQLEYEETNIDDYSDKIMSGQSPPLPVDLDDNTTDAVVPEPMERQELNSIMLSVLDESENDIEEITDCNHQEIMYILNCIFSDTENKMLMDNKELIIKYFEQNNIDGDALVDTYCESFGEKVSQYFDNQQLNEPSMEIWTLITNFNVSGVNWKEIEDKKMIADSLEACTVDDLVYVLNHDIFNSINNTHINENKDVIVSYFKTNDIDGNKLIEMGRKPFAQQLNDFGNDNKFTASGLKIYKTLKEYTFNQHEELKEEEEKFEEEKFDESQYIISDKFEEEKDLPPHEIPRLLPTTISNSLPTYIYKSIWDQSDDENLEKLVDECLRCVSAQDCWNNTDEIKALYRDGITGFSGQIYHDFVGKIYQEAGGSTFFDGFIENHYAREIKIWKYYTGQTTKLFSKDQIFDAIQKINIQTFGIDNEHGMDFEKFTEILVKSGYDVDSVQLREVFDSMRSMENNRSKVTLVGFDKFKRTGGVSSLTWRHSKDNRSGSTHSNEAKMSVNDSWYVYYNTKLKRYEFRYDPLPERMQQQYQLVATLPEPQDHEKIEIGIYLNKLIASQRKIFSKNHSNVQMPNGYWQKLTNYHNENKNLIPIKSIKVQMLPMMPLRLIFQLLNHYYLLTVDSQLGDVLKNDNTPLVVNARKSDKQLTEKVVFFIEKTEYELVWWNMKGTHETMAICIVNLTQYDAVVRRWETTKKGKKPKKLEHCYLRFEQPNNVMWQYYDHDKAAYKSFDMSNDELVSQLEMSFLSNCKQNFDPVVFNSRFNNCLLTVLTSYLNQSNIHDKDHTFRVLFAAANYKDDALNNAILSMEQITYSHQQSMTFTRNIQRLIDGKNSLDSMFQYSNQFIFRWKMNYKLRTEQQQLYFFAFITAICAVMKYIDIEFANQPVVLPAFDDNPDKYNIVEDLINVRDVSKEKKISKVFQGSLIPPNTAWQNASEANSNVKLSKTKILRKVLTPAKRKSSEDRVVYIQDEQDLVQFAEPHAKFLRLVECIRKYLLEFEATDTLQCLWPWNRNSFHSDSNLYGDVSNYDELIYKHNFATAWTTDDLMRQFNVNIFDEQPEPIRCKRKFAAQVLLEPQSISRNINLLRSQLKPLLKLILNEVFSDSSDSDVETKQKTIVTFCENQINDHTFWASKIKETNTKLQTKFNTIDKYGLFDEITGILKELTIDRFQLPIFEAFVKFFFIEWDKQLHHDIDKIVQSEWYKEFLDSWRRVPLWYNYNHDVLLLELVLKNGLNNDKIQSDLNGDKISQYKIRLDCNEQNTINNTYYEFKRWCETDFNILHRLKYTTNIITKHLQDKTYCGDISLVSVRIPTEMDQPSYKLSCLMFSDYQQWTHLKYTRQNQEINKLKFNPKTKLYGYDMTSKEINIEHSQCCICCTCIKSENQTIKYSYQLLKPIDNDEGYNSDIRIDMSNPSISLVRPNTMLSTTTSILEQKELEVFDKRSMSLVPTHISARSELMRDKIDKRIRQNDPFVERDINVELSETLQSFNLLIYGEPLVLFIINQLKKQNHPAYWIILGEILNALPYPLGISTLRNTVTQDVLRHAAPETLNQICNRLVDGSSFVACAALMMSAFFEDLATRDLSAEDTFMEYSNKFELMVCKEISFFESNNMLFVLFNVPLTQHNGQSLFSLALDKKRITLLHNDRIHSLIEHSFCRGILPPEEEIDVEEDTYYDMLCMILTQPIKFYLSTRGYHWTAGTLFILYLVFVYAYSYLTPITGQAFQDDEQSDVYIALEATLWSMNIAYVLYEVMHLYGKKYRQYIGSDTNHDQLDIAISAIWIFLFIIRIVFIATESSFDGNNVTALQKTYGFVFAIQIVLLTLRSLALFVTSEYLGILVKIIRLMLVQIGKFLTIFLLIMIGFLFGLWTVNATNKCAYPPAEPNAEWEADCSDYETNTLWDSFIYVFQVFLGITDLSAVGEAPLGIVFMMIATIFGTLILTTLLIALMTTEYENIRQTAKGEVVYIKAELTYDLSRQSRLLPPPLNILVLILAVIIDCFNFILSMISIKLNMYAYIEHQSFKNLKNFYIWKCKCIEYESVQASFYKFGSRMDIIKWYFIAWWLDWFKKENNNNNNNWKIIHRCCYGRLILNLPKQNTQTFQGITMSQYCERYEQKKKHNIEKADKKLLKQLTTNVLFCPYCYMPFLKDKIEKELTTPYIALLDYLSAVMFILLPVAWIPLILLFSILSFKDYIFGKSLYENRNEFVKYKHIDFDREYCANQFRKYQ